MRVRLRCVAPLAHDGGAAGLVVTKSRAVVGVEAARSLDPSALPSLQAVNQCG
jgi:hypothetical protein